MFRYSAAVAIALALGATAVASAHPELAEVAALSGADAMDVLPIAGGGIEIHACPGLGEEGPFDVVEFGPTAAGERSGVSLVMAAAPAGSCAHLVVFTQPAPNLAL